MLTADKNGNSLRQKISDKLTPRIIPPTNRNNKPADKSTPATINKMPPPILAKLQKKVNWISKYFKTNKPNNGPNNSNKLYVQVSKQSGAQISKSANTTSEIIKIKDTFPALNTQKINQIHKIVTGSPKPKPWIQMTTKGPSRKQVIIPMSSDNISKFMKNSSLHVNSINQASKNAKSEILVNFIWLDVSSVTVVTNKVAVQSNLYIIKNYIKKANDIDTTNINTPRLPQSKSYLKIIGIPYFPYDNLNKCLTSNEVEDIIKQNQIFDNVILASKPRIIKVSPKSNMSIIWIDIWDIQSGSKAKGLINRCFNVGRCIITIQGANMNPGVPQCKNCWKWGHVTLSCHIQEAKCIKCNGPHKTKNHHQFAWCYKANEKINPPHFETKKGEPCLYTFKCSNCCGDHQADFNLYPFWKHRFHREWHIKKYNEIHENRSTSIYSNMNNMSQWIVMFSNFSLRTLERTN